MKKQVLAVSAVLGIAAIALSAGTLAYFTDKDTATNTFTLGKVDIQLNEYDHEGNAFVQNQKLMPGSSSVAVAKEATVTVKDDSEPAWVWVEILIPAKLYASKDDGHETNNALHYNQFMDYLQGYENRTSPNANAAIARSTWPSDWQWTTFDYIDDVTVGGKTYSRLRSTHKNIMNAGEESSPAISQVYLDNDVKFENGKYYIPKAVPADTDPATEFEEYDGDWEIIVNAYGVQAEGLATVDAAVAAYAAQN